MKAEKFAIAFLRIYDRKIASGVISFSRLNMKKEDFTRLCTDTDYVLPEEEIQRLCQVMALTEEETELLLSFTGRE